MLSRSQELSRTTNHSRDLRLEARGSLRTGFVLSRRETVSGDSGMLQAIICEIEIDVESRMTADELVEMARELEIPDVITTLSSLHRRVPGNLCEVLYLPCRVRIVREVIVLVVVKHSDLRWYCLRKWFFLYPSCATKETMHLPHARVRAT
jgi:hypothetical protein